MYYRKFTASFLLSTRWHFKIYPTSAVFFYQIYEIHPHVEAESSELICLCTVLITGRIQACYKHSFEELVNCAEENSNSFNQAI